MFYIRGKFTALWSWKMLILFFLRNARDLHGELGEAQRVC